MIFHVLLVLNESNNKEKVANKKSMFTNASEMEKCFWKLNTNDDWSDHSMTGYLNYTTY